MKYGLVLIFERQRAKCDTTAHMQFYCLPLPKPARQCRSRCRYMLLPPIFSTEAAFALYKNQPLPDKPGGFLIFHDTNLLFSYFTPFPMSCPVYRLAAIQTGYQLNMPSNFFLISASFVPFDFPCSLSFWPISLLHRHNNTV